MSNLVPSTASSGMAGPYLDRRTSQALRRLEHQTIMRQAGVQAEGMVAVAKVHELGHTAETAAIRYTALYKVADLLGGPDPLLRDDLRLFTDSTRLAMHSVISELGHDLCRR